MQKSVAVVAVFVAAVMLAACGPNTENVQLPASSDSPANAVQGLDAAPEPVTPAPEAAVVPAPEAAAPAEPAADAAATAPATNAEPAPAPTSEPAAAPSNP